MDFAGPHPDNGYILVVIDTFTRWVELFHTTAATAEATVPCLVQIVGRYGAPKQKLSDRGTHFVNAPTPIYRNTTLHHYSLLQRSKFYG